MDKETKEKWTEALRSGKYKQGRRWLRNRDDEFCCLGVLADIVDSCGWSDGNFWNGAYFAALPHSILLRDTQLKLMSMNDDEGKSFGEIADYIEENL